MIVFNLICDNDHSFEGWFGSAQDFEYQQTSTLLKCPICSSVEISKALHAPHVSTGNASKPVKQENNKSSNESGVYANARQEIAQFIENLITNTEDVGDAFPEEARKIHYNEAPDRKIRGNASRDEVKELREEGIEVIALPIPKHRLGPAH